MMVRRPLNSAEVMERVREIRRSQGFRQRDFAAELGITQSAYSRLERGQCSISLTQLAMLACLCNMTPSELIDGLL